MDTIDWTKPIEHVSGFPARVHATDMGDDYPILVTVRYGKKWNTLTVTSDGRPHECGERIIRNVAPKRFRREVYLSIYQDGAREESDGLGIPRIRAADCDVYDHCAAQKPIARKRIIIEGNEGEFDE